MRKCTKNNPTGYYNTSNQEYILTSKILRSIKFYYRSIILSKMLISMIVYELNKTSQNSKE